MIPRFPILIWRMLAFELARGVTMATGAIVLVDPVSLQYMSGSVVDYVDDIMGQSFQINNPLASAGCGCGTSFSI